MHPRFLRPLLCCVVVAGLLAALAPTQPAQALKEAPPFTEDAALFADDNAVIQAHEGDELRFTAAISRPAPQDVTLVVELLFGPSADPKAASIRDLENNGTILASGNNQRFFIEVAIASGSSSAPVVIPTAADKVRNEGDVDGIERFRAEIIEIRGVQRKLTFAPALELSVEDATQAQRLGLLRRTQDEEPPTPTPDPVVGPLASASINFSVDTTGDRPVVTLHLPSSLRVWINPNGTMRILHGDTTIASADGTPATLMFEVPEGASSPFTVTVQGRLRSGAVYSENVIVARMGASDTSTGTN